MPALVQHEDGGASAQQPHDDQVEGHEQRERACPPSESVVAYPLARFSHRSPVLGYKGGTFRRRRCEPHLLQESDLVFAATRSATGEKQSADVEQQKPHWQQAHLEGEAVSLARGRSRQARPELGRRAPAAVQTLLLLSAKEGQIHHAGLRACYRGGEERRDELKAFELQDEAAQLVFVTLVDAHEHEKLDEHGAAWRQP
mmetsp:Transcript_65119/g.194734  ORF Transcript_65119/g.194734 Transcript_65119/m.194734 type:complete len:200 (+) Transcript_65119:559-1158(+)|eukprot:7388221-Prymnesium_polylepis.2